jgi:hypothetical protein
MYRYRVSYQTPTQSRKVTFLEALSIADARALARGRIRHESGYLGRVENMGKVKAEGFRASGWRSKVPTGPLSAGCEPRDGLEGELVGKSERTDEEVVLMVDEDVWLDVIAKLKSHEVVRLDIDPLRVIERRKLTFGDYGYNND